MTFNPANAVPENKIKNTTPKINRGFNPANAIPERFASQHENYIQPKAPASLSQVPQGALNAVKNFIPDIPKSAYEMAKMGYGAFRNTVNNLNTGGPEYAMQRAAPVLGDVVSYPVKKAIDVAVDPMGELQRQGEYIQERPAMAALNLATALEGGGALTGVKGLTTVGKAINPINLTVNTARGVGSVPGVLKRAITPGVESGLTKAIIPSKNNSTFASSLKSSLPEINMAAKSNGFIIDSLDNLNKAIKIAKADIWNEYKKVMGQASGSTGALATVDTTPVADAMVNSMNKRFIEQNPAAAQRIRDIADTYRNKTMTVDQAEEYINSANSDLASFYEKNKVKQGAALRDPEVAHVVREAEALRDVLYKKLEELTGTDAAAIKKRYGALLSIEKESVPRAVTASRQAPMSLQQQIHTPMALAKIAKSAANLHIGDTLEGVGQLAFSKLVKKLNTPDEMVKNAFQRYNSNIIKTSPTSNYSVPAAYGSVPNYALNALNNKVNEKRSK